MATDYESLKQLGTHDLESSTREELFEHLQSSPGGISSEDAERRLEIFGLNKLEEKKDNNILKFLRFNWNPLTWVMEVAAVMAIALANGGGKPPDWQEFIGIVMLLLINSTISFIEENNASNAVAALMAHLSLKAMVLRDGQWSEVDASILVPGDIISIKLGDIVAADACLLDGDPLKIDQSALTGESGPVFKAPGERVYSGSICKQGEINAIVYATGLQTFHGEVAHDSTNKQGHFQKVFTAIGTFCICTIAVGMFTEIIVMYLIQKRPYRSGINNLLVLLIGGIPIAMPTVLSVTLAIGSHRLSQQGAITKRMAVIEEMAGMDVLCSDMTGTLTLNKLKVEKDLVHVIAKGVSVEAVILMAARAVRLENQDATDAAILGMMSSPQEARAGIQEIHFLPFNPTEKRTALTYTDNQGKMYRASKGAPEEILNLVDNKTAIQDRVHNIVNRFAEYRMHSLAVAYQEVPDGSKESPGGPWVFLGLIPLLDSLRDDNIKSIREALNLGLQVKLITGDHLDIARGTGYHLGMGKIFPCSAIFGPERHTLVALPADSMIEEADGFASVLSEHKYEIVKRLQARKHICGITGDGVNDAPSLKIADIGIVVANATDAARDASDIVLTEPGLTVIINAVSICRAIFQRMKNYTIYAVSITTRTVLGFVLLELIWKFDFPPFMVLIIALLNDGTITAMSKFRVKPSLVPGSWKLVEILATGIALGTYLAITTVVFVWATLETSFFTRTFGVATLQRGSPNDVKKIASAVYLQVSTSSQALIFVTRARSWSLTERPGFLPVLAFLFAQTVATVIAVYANWGFADIQGIGWKWAGVVWLYNLAFYVPLDFIKLLVQYVRTGKAWDQLVERKIAFMRKKHERDRKWAMTRRLALLDTNSIQPDQAVTPAYLIWMLAIVGGIGLGYTVTAPASLVKFERFINLFWPNIFHNKKKAYETNVSLYCHVWLFYVSTATPILASPCVIIAWILSSKWGKKITFLLGSVSWGIGAGLIAIDAIWHTEKARLLISGLCIQGFGVGALSQVIPMIIRDSVIEERDAINRIFKHSYLLGTTLANLIYYICAHNLNFGWIIPMSFNVIFPVLVTVVGVLLREPLQQNEGALNPQFSDWSHFRNKPKVLIYFICQLWSSFVGVGSIIFIGPVLLESMHFTKRQSFLGPLVASLCGLVSFALSELGVYFRMRRWPVIGSFLVVGLSQLIIWIISMLHRIDDTHHWPVVYSRAFIGLNISAVVGYYIAAAPASLTADPYHGQSSSIGATFEASFRLLMTGVMGILIFLIFRGMGFHAFLFMGCVGMMLAVFVYMCVPETYVVAEPANIYDVIWEHHWIWRHLHTSEDVQV